MIINVAVVGDQAVITRLRALPDQVRRALVRKVTVLAIKLQGRVQRKLTGEVLNVVTGALRRSIQWKVSESPTSVVGTVYSSGDVKYAAIHEFGGKTAAHEIVARKANALAFLAGGKMVFTRRVQHPGSVMPERSFMRSSLAEMQGEIVAELEAAVKGALR